LTVAKSNNKLFLLHSLVCQLKHVACGMWHVAYTVWLTHLTFPKTVKYKLVRLNDCMTIVCIMYPSIHLSIYLCVQSILYLTDKTSFINCVLLQLLTKDFIGALNIIDGNYLIESCLKTTAAEMDTQILILIFTHTHEYIFIAES